MLLTETPLKTSFYDKALNLTVLVTGLGYFIDVFDLFLYNSMRVVSLTELGLSADTLTKIGMLILNCQVFGALIGSFFWGVLGDKIGRKKALLGSIFIYSLGMVANGFTQNVLSYEIIRFVIGFGAAGEVGLGATLVAETIQSSKRTYALMFFTIMGVMGVVVAGLSIEFVNWRKCCFIGGGIGLLLLTLRSVLFESPFFVEATKMHVVRGSLRALFGNLRNLKRYILCIPLLSSNFFITGVLLTLTPEIAKANNIQGSIKANIALAIYFFTAVFGDLLGAWLSEVFKSRKIVTGIFILGNLCLAFLILQKLNLDSFSFYFLCASFGLFNLWALSGTILVEEFSTGLRATATTSNINCSRASVILMNFALLYFKPLGITSGLLIVAATVFALALFLLIPSTGKLRSIFD